VNVLAFAALALALALHAPASRAPGDAVTRAQVARALDAIDRPATAAEWRALGARAVPVLEEVLADHAGFPSRRAAAVHGLAAIGGDRPRVRVLTTARDRAEPLALRAAAIRAAPLLLSLRALRAALSPLLDDPDAAVRAVASETLAASASAIARRAKPRPAPP
jgi:hypothetical protein